MEILSMYREIRLTPAEAELWDWACQPMHEFWADEEDREYNGQRSYPPDTAIREAANGVGQIVDDPSVADDLIYRVETQMDQMGRMTIKGGGWFDRTEILRDIGAGKRLAAKVRKAFGMDS